VPTPVRSEIEGRGEERAGRAMFSPSSAPQECRGIDRLVPPGPPRATCIAGHAERRRWRQSRRVSSILSSLARMGAAPDSSEQGACAPPPSWRILLSPCFPYGTDFPVGRASGAAISAFQARNRRVSWAAFNLLVGRA